VLSIKCFGANSPSITQNDLLATPDQEIFNFGIIDRRHTKGRR